MEKIEGILAGKDEKVFDLLVAIVGRGFSDYVVSAARNAGATGATIIYGRGTSDYDKQVMGISLQPEREVVLVVVKKEDRQKVMKAICDETSVIEEGRGLCFSMPITQIYGMARAEKHKKEQLRRAKELEKSELAKEKKADKKKTKSAKKTAKKAEKGTDAEQ